MGLRIRTNVASVNAQRNLSLTTGEVQENMSKLSSGYRINKAADDAAGLAISENMRGKVRSLVQARRNATDGVSLVQVAEGSFNEVTNIVIRLRELATQAASDTIGNNERMYSNREYVQLVNEVERIANTTEWNGLSLLKGQDALDDESMFTLHVGAGSGAQENTDTIRINVEHLKLDLEEMGLAKEAEIGPVNPGDAFLRETAAGKLQVLDDALQSIASSRAFLGSQQSRLNSTINNLGVQIENLRSSNSRIRDVDFAEETAAFAQNKILQAAGVSMLTQANAAPDVVMQLLR